MEDYKHDIMSLKTTTTTCACAFVSVLYLTYSIDVCLNVYAHTKKTSVEWSECARRDEYIMSHLDTSRVDQRKLNKEDRRLYDLAVNGGHSLTFGIVCALCTVGLSCLPYFCYYKSKMPDAIVRLSNKDLDYALPASARKKKAPQERKEPEQKSIA
jgi:hypothetical protein